MKKIIPHILFTLLIVFFSNCEFKKDNISKKNYSNNNLKIILTDPVETLDPLKILYSSDWRVASNIFEGLMAFDQNDNIQYELVDTVIVSSDKLNYTFILKDNIYFHDSPCFKDGVGRLIDSRDITYTFERLSSKENNFSNWQLLQNKIVGIDDFYNGKVDSIAGLKIIDYKTLVISLTKPYGSFLKILASPNFYIVPKEAINYYKTRFEFNPIGTGPFRLSEFKKYESVILVKNEKYHLYDNSNQRLPKINLIEYSTIDNSESIISEFIKGNSDIISINQTNYKTITNNNINLKNYKIQKLDKGLGLRYWSFYFDEKNSEEQVVLRRIIAQEFYSRFKNNSSLINNIAHTLVPKHLLGIDEPYQSSMQRENIIQEFIPKDTISIMANMQYDDLTLLENIFEDLSIPYRKIIKPDNYYQEISNYKPFMFRVSMIPSFPDPTEYYSLFYSLNSTSVNLGNYSNQEFDRHYEYIQTESIGLKKLSSYKKMEQILREETAAIYLTHQGPIYYIYSDRIQDLKFRYILPDFRELYFK